MTTTLITFVLIVLFSMLMSKNKTIGDLKNLTLKQVALPLLVLVGLLFIRGLLGF
jgi:hypothetical protein